MLLAPESGLHLTYCTNIHAADGWDAVRSNIERFAPALKRRLSPDAPFGVGLRLSAVDARELLTGDHLSAFRQWLDGEGLYVAIINGFPHGLFHRSAVKAQVYAPDWRDPERLRYTLDLIEILRALVPAGLDGGVSTAPLSYKPWLAKGGAADWYLMTSHIVKVAERLARLREEAGTLVHLDIEPEPDCLLENTDETIDFFEQWLWRRGAPLLAHALGRTVDEARECLADHIRVCFDCCHFAVEHEDPIDALDRLRHVGIKIGRIQLSSALKVDLSGDVESAAATRARLRHFADSTYLHQVIAERADGFVHYPDLGDALDAAASPLGDEWRIHFHVPLFMSDYDGLSSTQDEVRSVLAAVRQEPITTHLEIETYTWDVLPRALKIDLVDSIGREYEWVLGALSTDR